MKAWIIVLFALSIAQPASAFVENVTHGYQNCKACHVSGAGGDLLTEYGRSLSNELMSTWGWAGSEQPLFGALNNSENVLWGGDIRAIQTHVENDNIRRGSFFLMQRNIELGYRWAKTWFVGTIGTQEGPDSVEGKGQFLSERHYALFEASDSTNFRVGKFRIHYGLNDPNHTRPIKALLGFGALSETYNLEMSHFTENYEVFVTAGLGQLIAEPRSGSERSLSAVAAYYLGKDSKIGINALVGESDDSRRTLGGVWGVFGPWENGVILTELDYQVSHAADTPTEDQQQIVGHLRLGHRFYKGVLGYLVYEHSQTDFDDPDTVRTSPGVGVQWLPIPHLELQAEYQRSVLAAQSGQATDTAWLLLHFYL